MKIVDHYGDTWRGVRMRRNRRGETLMRWAWAIAILASAAIIAARELAK